MTKSLAQLNKQIAALQAQAEAVKKKEAAGVIARIKEAIAHYGLSAADLGLTGKAPKAAKAAKAVKAPKPGRKPGRKKAAKTGVIKYRDGTNTWTGHGRRPQWYVAAIAAGKKPEDLLA
jgi:DNA-binding protein H-NS